jgi:hypothetical protein
MKYVVIIDSDDELSEDAIKNSEEILFLGDENAMYYCEITSIKEAPEKIGNYVIGNFQEGYNSALIDCGVINNDSN